ncbi:fluoride efflux transporter FluC [Halopelagius longus]|uniref:Fluoride-specific ion channel FluC n=1 Tax=Halopelagius longus TaxID=1236180 RepID=A0A1H1E1T8_9EURY|nr:CrcB family protein [Halopelagius longus]RDI71560.1 CrcB family protein [Halopelagius longus]SDQ82468.1 CrcB protein [Halopelagius longus]
MSGVVAAAGHLPPAVLVGLGGSAGALARYGVDTALESGRRATLSVNVLGSVVLGAVVAASPPSVVATALGTGFCGAFTTFSSFAVAVAADARDGREGEAVRYAAVTLGTALVGVAVGTALVGAV